MIIKAVADLASTILNRLLPADKNKQAELDFEKVKQEFAKEMQEALLESNLLTKQIDVNEAEAANPNRKWATWRELIGYAGAAAIWYNYVIQPLVVMFSNLIGYPLDQNVLVQLNIGDLLSLIFGMLGISYTPAAISYVGKTVTNRLKK